MTTMMIYVQFLRSGRIQKTEEKRGREREKAREQMVFENNNDNSRITRQREISKGIIIQGS